MLSHRLPRSVRPVEAAGRGRRDRFSTGRPKQSQPGKRAWTPETTLEALQALISPSTLSNWDELYQVSTTDLEKAGCASNAAMRAAQPDLPVAIAFAFPAHHWKAWEFAYQPGKAWRESRDFALRGDPIALAFLRELSQALHQENIPQGMERVLAYLGGQAELTSLLSATPEAPQRAKRSGSPRPTAASDWVDPKVRFQYIQGKLLKHMGGKLHRLYAVKVLDFVQTGGAGLVALFNVSPIRLVATELPLHSWAVWRHLKSPSSMWSQLASRVYLDPVARCAVEGWLADESTDLSSGLNQTRLQLFGGESALQAKLSADYRSSVAGLGFDPSRLANSAEERRLYFAHLLDHYCNGELDRMHQLTPEVIKQSGGQRLLQRNHNAVAMMLVNEFPRGSWKLWKFLHAPAAMWERLGADYKAAKAEAVAAVGEFFDFLSSSSWNVSFPADYYQLRKLDLNNTDWPKLGVDLAEYLRNRFPTESWEAHRFLFNDHFDWWAGIAASVINNQASRHLLADSSEFRAVKAYFDEFARTHRLASARDWDSLIASKSLPNAETQRLVWLMFDLVLPIIYPTLSWRPWRLVDKSLPWWTKLGQRFASDADTIRTDLATQTPRTLVYEFIKEVEEELGMQTTEEWAVVSPSAVSHFHAQRMLALTQQTTLPAALHAIVQTASLRPDSATNRRLFEVQQNVSTRVAEIL